MRESEIIAEYIGLQDTMELLTIRELIKRQMPTELWDANMESHKYTLEETMKKFPGITVYEASEIICRALDKDISLDPERRERWKILSGLAAFELSEF